MCVDCILSMTLIASFRQFSRSDNLSGQTLTCQNGNFLEQEMSGGGLCTKLSSYHKLAF